MPRKTSAATCGGALSRATVSRDIDRARRQHVLPIMNVLEEGHEHVRGKRPEDHTPRLIVHLFDDAGTIRGGEAFEPGDRPLAIALFYFTAMER